MKALNKKIMKQKNSKDNGNIIIAKKKKSSHNNVVNVNSSNKKMKIETSFDENNLLKNKNQKDISFQNNTPIINKVLIFEIGNSKIFNNVSSNENNSNNNLNNANNLNNNNHSYKNIIHKEKLKNNKNNLLFNNEITPKKNKITK